MKTRAIGILAPLLLLAACATAPPAQDDTRVIELIDRFNTTSGVGLADYAELPFLFGDEVLYSETDLRPVLARVKEAGLILSPEIVGSTTSIAAPDGSRFDVALFFDRLPDDARLVVTPSTAGDVTLVLAGAADGLPLLRGIVRGQP